MLETYFSAPKMLAHLRNGPGGPYLDSFAAKLKRDGYSPAIAVRYLRAAGFLRQAIAGTSLFPAHAGMNRDRQPDGKLEGTVPRPRAYALT